MTCKMHKTSYNSIKTFGNERNCRPKFTRCSIWTILRQNLFSIIHNVGKEEQELISVMLWNIWKQKNNKVRNNVSKPSQVFCDRASNLRMSWKNAHYCKQ